MTNVYFRVDGSPVIGLGHLVRCMALAKILKHEFSLIFISKNIPEEFRTEIESEQIKVIVIEKEQDFFILVNPKSIIVLDGYEFKTEYQKKIKALGVKLVCIDDLHNQEFFADLIINHSPNVNQSVYRAQHYTKFALGLEYALLRYSFIENAKNKRSIEKIDTIMICFGGSDTNNLTKTTIEEVVRYPHYKKIIVITGSAYSYINSLNYLLNIDDRITHFHSIDEKQMISLMIESDLAIVPSSSILLELFTVGVAAITGYYVDNQKEASENIVELGYAISCGNMLSNYRENLKTILDKFTLENGIQMVKRQKTIIWPNHDSFIKYFKAIEIE